MTDICFGVNLCFKRSWTGQVRKNGLPTQEMGPFKGHVNAGWKDLLFRLVLTRLCGCGHLAGPWQGPASPPETHPEPDSHCSTNQLCKGRKWKLRKVFDLWKYIIKLHMHHVRYNSVALCVCVQHKHIISLRSNTVKRDTINITTEWCLPAWCLKANTRPVQWNHLKSKPQNHAWVFTFESV